MAEAPARSLSILPQNPIPILRSKETIPKIESEKSPNKHQAFNNMQQAALVVAPRTKRMPHRFEAINTNDKSGNGGLECHDGHVDDVVYDTKIPELIQCTRKHERSHLHDVLNSRPDICEGHPNGARISAVGIVSDLTEYKAYQEGKQCYEELARTLPFIDRSLWEELQKRISFNEQMLENIRTKINRHPQITNAENAIYSLRRIFGLEKPLNPASLMSTINIPSPEKPKK